MILDFKILIAMATVLLDIQYFDMKELIAIEGVVGNIHSDNPKYDQSGRGWKRSYWTYPSNELFDVTRNVANINVVWTWFMMNTLSIQTVKGETQMVTQDMIDQYGNVPLVFDVIAKHGEYGTIVIQSAVIKGVFVDGKCQLFDY